MVSCPQYGSIQTEWRPLVDHFAAIETAWYSDTAILDGKSSVGRGVDEKYVVHRS